MNQIISDIFAGLIVIGCIFSVWSDQSLPLGTIYPVQDFGAVCDDRHDNTDLIMRATMLAQRLKYTIEMPASCVPKPPDSIQLDGK